MGYKTVSSLGEVGEGYSWAEAWDREGKSRVSML